MDEAVARAVEKCERDAQTRLAVAAEVAEASQAAAVAEAVTCATR